MTVKSTHDALEALGVTPASLSEQERHRLDEDGFLAIEDALDADQIVALRRRVDELVALEGDRAGIEVHREAGTDRVSDLVNKGAVFDDCWTYPKQLAAVSHVLGGHEMKLYSLNARASLPGSGHQALHADWGEGVAPDEFQVCNSLWMLDDFTADNGATRVVPGSHRWGKLPAEALADPAEDHPDQVLVTGRAGTVVMFNSHLWHGGRLNRSSRPRHALHAFFGRREGPQQTPQQKYLRPETVSRIPAAALYLLDVV
jgi:ectoine hydroxylase-related dioxygenase (phytanoyl-CoA dioxygenase family)